MMTLYRTDGMRAVTADGATPAAHIFARRLARREYGRRGRVGLVRLDSWTASGQTHTFQAFIGTPSGNGMAGKNIWLTVTQEAAP